MLEKNILPRLDKRRINAVTRADVLGMRNKMSDAPYNANHAGDMLKAIFNKTEVRPDAVERQSRRQY